MDAVILYFLVLVYCRITYAKRPALTAFLVSAFFAAAAPIIGVYVAVLWAR